MASNLVLLVARVLLAAIFVLSGFGKLTNLANTAGYFTHQGLPAPTALAVAVGVVELVGGLAVLLGFRTRIAAWALGLFCVATALVAHTDFAQAGQLVNFQKNLAMCGGFLALAMIGAGGWSLDGRRAA